MVRKAFLLLGLSLFAFGEENLEEKIKRLEEELESLKKEVRDLRRVKEEAEVLKEEFRKLRLDIILPPQEYERRGGLGPAASKVYIKPTGVSIGGYGELYFKNNPGKEPALETDLKRLIIYLGYSFSENFKFNSEIEIEHAYIKDGEKGSLAVEFAYLDWSFSPSFGLRGGMVLIPVGIVNEVHEPPTFFTAERPFLEQNIIPTTWRENGVGVYGETELLAYRFYVVNGMMAEEGSFKESAPLKYLRQNGSVASMNSLAFTGRLDLKLPRNLTLGASAFISGVQDSTGDSLGTVYLFSPHLWWQYGGYDVRFVGVYATTEGAEDISLELSPPDCTQSGSCRVFPESFYGFYFQVAYNILRHFDTEQELYLFGMYENYDTHAEVPAGFVKPQGSKVQIFNFGFSYKPHPLVALKLDYVRKDYEDKRDEDLYRGAITWMF
ncbi:MAG: DUF3373 domain-containing protein [Aquificae bacterium]|nr:DUF3373 domain-containing protein [Aquificota bacterium]